MAKSILYAVIAASIVVFVVQFFELRVSEKDMPYDQANPLWLSVYSNAALFAWCICKLNLKEVEPSKELLFLGFLFGFLTLMFQIATIAVKVMPPMT